MINGSLIMKIPRDPRFLPTAGQFSPEKFHKQYSFLAESHKTELATLRESLKRARKLLSSSPRDLRSEREQEVERLERAVKRAESIVNKDRLDQVEREAMSKVKKDEREKRAHGKNPWYLKKGKIPIEYVMEWALIACLCQARSTSCLCRLDTKHWRKRVDSER